MELTAEETVTKMLSSKEILRLKSNEKMFVTNPGYNFGGFLEDVKNEPSPYGEKYMFIK